MLPSKFRVCADCMFWHALQLVRRWELALLEAPDSSALFCHHYPVRVLAAGKHDTLVSGDSYGEVAVWTVA